MAVVTGGFYGQYFVDYQGFTDSRQWNTKSYDYAVVKNKGEIGEDAKNETPGVDQTGTSLFVKANKYGYKNADNGFIKDLDNPVYQIRDRDGNINNSYYVDQKTGNVYLRPTAVPAIAAQTYSVLNAAYDYDAGTVTTLSNFAVNMTNSTSSTAVQTYNWSTINPGYTVDMVGQYSSDNGATWTDIPGASQTLTSASSPTGQINYIIPLNANRVRFISTITPPAATTTVAPPINHTYEFSPSVVAPQSLSDDSGPVDLSDAVSALVTMEYDWNIPTGATATPVVQYSLDGTTWVDIPTSQVALNSTTSNTNTITANVPMAALTQPVEFRVKADIVGGPGIVAPVIRTNYSFPPIVAGSGNISTTTSSPIDLTNTSGSILVMNYDWTIPQGGSATPQVQYSTDGTTWNNIPATATTLYPVTPVITFDTPSNSTSVLLSNVTGIAAGNTLSINGQIVNVNGVSGNTVSFTPPLTAIATAGTVATGNREGSSIAIDLTALTPSAITSGTIFRLQANATSGPSTPTPPVTLVNVTPYVTGTSYPPAINLDLSGNAYGPPINVTSQFTLANIPVNNPAIYGRQEYWNGIEWKPIGDLDEPIPFSGSTTVSYATGTGYTPNLLGIPAANVPINTVYDFEVAGTGIIGATTATMPGGGVSTFVDPPQTALSVNLAAAIQINENFEGGLNNWTATNIIGDASKVTWQASGIGSIAGTKSAYFGNINTSTLELNSGQANVPETLDVYVNWTNNGTSIDIDTHVIEPASTGGADVTYNNTLKAGKFVTDNTSGTSSTTIPSPGSGSWDEHYLVTTNGRADGAAGSTAGTYDVRARGFSAAGNTNYPITVSYQVIADQGTARAAVYDTGSASVTAGATVSLGSFTIADSTRVAGELLSPVINLTGKSGGVFTFKDSYQTEALSAYDTKKVYISDDNGSTWTEITNSISPPVGATSGTQGTTTHTYNIPASYNNQPDVRIKFAFDSVDGRNQTGRGWNIDDIKLETTGASSMTVVDATGIVAGSIVEVTTTTGVQTVTVSSVVGNVLTFSPDITSPAVSGASVKVIYPAGTTSVNAGSATGITPGSSVSINGEIVTVGSVSGDVITFAPPLTATAPANAPILRAYPAGSTTITLASVTGISAGSTLLINGQIVTVSSVNTTTKEVTFTPGLLAPLISGDPVSIVNPQMYARQEYSSNGGVTWNAVAGSNITIPANSSALLDSISMNGTLHPLTVNSAPPVQVRMQIYKDASHTVALTAAENSLYVNEGTLTATKHIPTESEIYVPANYVPPVTVPPTTSAYSATVITPPHDFFDAPAQKIRFMTYSDPFFTTPSNAGYTPGNGSVVKNLPGSPIETPVFTSGSIDIVTTGPLQLPTFISTPNNLQIIKTIPVPPAPAPTFTSGNITINKSTEGIAAGIQMATGTVVNNYTPQYFGTTFNLETVPNPEEFGLGRPNNINYTSTLIPVSPLFPDNNTYTEIIVNGISIASGGLNTGLKTAIPTDPADAFYTFANSFTSGAQNFTPNSGTWTYNTGTPSGNYSVGSGGGQSNFNSRTADNFVLSVNLSNVAAGQKAGVQIRTAQAVDGVGDSGYFVYVQNGTLRIAKDGVDVASGPAPAMPIEIHANGTEIRVGSISYNDTSPSAYTDGFISLRSTGAATFDDFSVTSYDQRVQLLYKALKKGENSIVIKAIDSQLVNVVAGGTIGVIPAYTNPASTAVSAGVNISTTNIPPDLLALATAAGETLDITHRAYRGTTLNPTAATDPFELDPLKAYWSGSTNSSLGIAGVISFKNREGGSLQKTKDQFNNQNSMLSNLTSILGATDDLFNSHLNLIK